MKEILRKLREEYLFHEETGTLHDSSLTYLEDIRGPLREGRYEEAAEAVRMGLLRDEEEVYSVLIEAYCEYAEQEDDLLKAKELLGQLKLRLPQADDEYLREEILNAEMLLKEDERTRKTLRILKRYLPYLFRTVCAYYPEIREKGTREERVLARAEHASFRKREVFRFTGNGIQGDGLYIHNGSRKKAGSLLYEEMLHPYAEGRVPVVCGDLANGGSWEWQLPKKSDALMMRRMIKELREIEK